MGVVGTSAGSGKVTAENLEPQNIRKGVKITLKSGARTVRQVSGTLISQRTIMILGYSYNNGMTEVYKDASVISGTAQNFTLNQSGNIIARWVDMKEPPRTLTAQVFKNGQGIANFGGDGWESVKTFAVAAGDNLRVEMYSGDWGGYGVLYLTLE